MLYYTNYIFLLFSAEVNASFVALVGTCLALLFTSYQFWLTRKDSKKNALIVDLSQKKQILENKLNEFYVPLRHHLENSKTLFKILKKGKPAKFRTLTYLLDKKQIYSDTNKKVKLKKNDISLIKAIIKIGKKIETLIHEKSYLIGDDKEFVKEYIPRQEYQHLPFEQDMTLLSLLASHIISIRMAFNDDLSGQKDKFEGFVFPNEINIRVIEKITQIESQINSLENQILKLNK